MLTYGNIWTPNLLDLIDEKEINIADVQEFWNAEKIISTKSVNGRLTLKKI